MDRTIGKIKGLLPSYNLSSQRVHILFNLKLDNGVEDVFHILTSSRKERESAHLGLDRRTKNGDTLLHRVVHATVEHPEDMDHYMQLVDLIAADSVTWWCKKKMEIPTSDDLRQKYKYDAMKYLLTSVEDGQKRTVWKLAFEVVSVEMIRKLLFLEGVTCSRKTNGIYFDMSQFTRDGNVTGSNCLMSICGLYCNFHRQQPGLAKLLKFANEKKKVAEILSVKAVNKLVDMYSSFTTKLYVFIVFIHILYMSVVSYAGCDLMDSKNTSTSVTTKGLLYGIGLIEPIFLSFYLICELLKCIVVLCGSSHKVDKTEHTKSFVVRFSVLLVYTALLFDVISRVDQEIRTVDRNVLSVALLTGWLLTFALADGIQPVHFFFRLVLKVLATDILKVLLVYVIFLAGFSLSMHAQFISSSNITSTYKTPVETMFLMFNVMMGLEQAIDDNTEYLLGAVNASVLLSKLLYIGYTLCCAIVLINLVIAMMNTSYSKIREQYSAEWVTEASLFGIRTSEYFPALSRRFGVNYVRYGNIFKSNITSEKGLYLVLDQEDLQEDESVLETSSNEEVDLDQVDNNVRLSEIRLRNQITELGIKQEKMMECIQEMRIQLTKLRSGSGTQ